MALTPEERRSMHVLTLLESRRITPARGASAVSRQASGCQVPPDPRHTVGRAGAGGGHFH